MRRVRDETLDDSGIISKLRQRISDDEVVERFREEYERWRQYNISALSLPLLTYLLSHVDLSDVFSIALVCKKWNEVFHCDNFWKKFILKATGIKTFNNFFFKERETMRYQLQWLFQDQRSKFIQYFVVFFTKKLFLLTYFKV